MGERPSRLVVVTATGTEVGKTWLCARLLEQARAAGVRVAARKPAQSFEAGDTTTDAHVLAAASGDDPAAVCPPHRWYEMPMAPFMAAAHLGRPPFTLADLVAELAWPPGTALGLLEGAGGVRSPVTSDGADAVDLAAAIAADAVVLVADAGLGTLNAVRLCVAALDGTPTVVFLNRFDAGDPLHAANLAWLRGRLGVPVEIGPAGVLARLG